MGVWVASGRQGGHFSPVTALKPKSPTAELFKSAPAAVRKLRQQATRELRLKARAQWWQHNRPKQ